MDTNKAVELWKSLGIDKCEMQFSCGGDSMNDYSFKFLDNGNKEVESNELTNYFDNKIFDEVTFYEASDGHYIGEFGYVLIGLEEEDGEPYFTYAKQSKSEWSESYTDVLEVKLTKKEADFIRKYVLAIGGNIDEDTNVVFKSDFFMTDEDEKTLKSIEDKVYNVAESYEPEAEGDAEDWFTFTTALNGNEIDDVDNQIKIEGNKLHLRVNRSVTEVREEDY